MTVPNWSWPPSGETARGIALIPFGAAGLAVADWTQPMLWPYANGAFLPGINVGSGSVFGLGGAGSDGAGGAWTVTLDGLLMHTELNTTQVAFSMPSGAVYNGAASINGSGFALSAAGLVYTSAGGVLGSFPVFGRGLYVSGTTLATLLPASGIGAMNSSNGATGLVASPGAIATPAVIAIANGQPLAMAGWSSAALLSGAAAAVLDPQNGTLMAAVGSGYALQWQAPSIAADEWNQLQVLTGLADLNAVTWSDDGTKVLACSLASGAQALTYAAGLLSLAQTIPITGACSVVILSDSAHALVAQSGHSQATPLVYTSSWASGAAITGLPGITALANYGPSGAIAAISGGLQYLNNLSGTWTLGASATLSFTPTALTVDSYGYAWCAGVNNAALVSGTTVLATGSWSTGDPATSVAVQQGRMIVAVPADNLLRVFGWSASGVLSQQSHVAYGVGTTVGLALSETTLFAMSPTGTATFGFSGSPYVLTPVLSGVAGFYDGSSWTTVGMGIGNVPSAIGLDASGNAWITTMQNTLWNISSGGSVLSSGVLQQEPAQPQTVPLCPSALIVASGGVYVATSIPGLLTQVV